MDKDSIKNIFKDNSGCNFIIKTSLPYYDETDKCIKYLEFPGDKTVITTNNTTGNITSEYTYKTYVKEITSNYILINYIEVCYDSNYYGAGKIVKEIHKYINIDNIISIETSIKYASKKLKAQWVTENWIEESVNNYEDIKTTEPQSDGSTLYLITKNKVSTTKITMPNYITGEILVETKLLNS